MRILLLGATGQIGYALSMALARSEHQVSALVRRSPGLRFPDTVAVTVQPKFTQDVLARALDGADHVIYCLGLPEQFAFDTRVFETVNCELLETVLDAMRSSRVRKLTYISSYEVFQAIDGVIDETRGVADESHMTPYSQSKVRAYRQVVDFAQANDVELTTIHPAAVFGGLNTGAGITDYMENLKLRKWYRVPFINEGNFPVIHVDSLACLIIKSLNTPGAYIANDQMTSLKGIAQTMRTQARSYVPMIMPLPVVKLGVFLMEAIAKVIRLKPLVSSVQIDFLTRGLTPDPDKAIRELHWTPMPLAEGIRRLLAKPLASAVAYSTTSRPDELLID
jgi:nucleoside-diphosphate-sugar epimerase